MRTFPHFEILVRILLFTLCTLVPALQPRGEIRKSSIRGISSIWGYFCFKVCIQVGLSTAKSISSSDYQRSLAFGKNYPGYCKASGSPSCIWINHRPSCRDPQPGYLQAHPWHKPSYNIRRILECRFHKTKLKRYYLSNNQLVHLNRVKDYQRWLMKMRQIWFIYFSWLEQLKCCEKYCWWGSRMKQKQCTWI